MPLGVELPDTASRSKSVVFLTMHKAGSVYVTGILRRLLLNAGIPHVDFAAESFRNGVPEGPYCVERSQVLSTPGYFFGAFRGTYVQNFDDLSAARLIIQVRDPRDCIVSMYFSLLYSHPQPGEGEVKERLLNARSHVESTPIDDFAIERAAEYRKRLDVLADIMTSHSDCLLLRYEQMVTDFDSWINGLADYLNGDTDMETVAQIVSTANFEVMENPHKHVRQVTPGDHKRKLRLETQQKMTEILADQLERYGYV